MSRQYVIGIDYGTDSVRSIVVDAENGDEIASEVHHYQRWKTGKYCDPSKNQFRQHPLDYLEGLEFSVKGALKKAGIPPSFSNPVSATACFPSLVSSAD